ncbi:hypothetical protein E4U16_004600 [Claviceps sp. LM84 group G4]|nr:hypothetical protein E4U16_004600 [Claviceps sp. LM84 group G4]KAG6086806.1 hypothetical protein E4U33_000048 [Claviceps sp. LM78 group G4]
MEAFPTWAHFTRVRFAGVKLADVGDGKGQGLVATAKLSHDEAAATEVNECAVLRIPSDLVLSAEAVDAYAKVDHNFKQLLDVAGRKASLKAKLAALQTEFELLHDLSEDLPFWNTLFWTQETILLEDWLLVDAWYRSRCLELPTSGTAMVPALDMVNHSGQPSALYEEEGTEDVVLLVRPETSVSEGKEITISYGQAKSASEMLFNYGFVDPSSSVSTNTMTLHLRPLPDDPLAGAKAHIFNGAKLVKLSSEAGNEDQDRRCTWDSPFIYLMCLNEEDGLSFQLLQDTEGNRSLRLFWQEEDVTQRADDFENLIKGHELCQVFRLRAVTIVLQTVEEQLAGIQSGSCDAENEASQADGILRSDCIVATQLLKDVEEKLLIKAVESLSQERDALLEDDHVVAYLGLAESSDMEDADFS